jgi:CRP-like cAMP-binding protein
VPAPAGRLAPALDQALRSRARVRRIDKGSSLYTCGSPPDALFCVERGLVRLSVTAANGREAVLSVLEPGQWFGELSVFSNAARVHNASAVVDSELLVLSAADFHDIVDGNPAFLLDFLRLVCNRYKSVLHRIDAIILFPLPVRLARFLVAEMETQLAASREGEPVLRLSQENLGQMLGVARQSVNRQLKEWETQGVLRLEYGRIVVSDQVALYHLAEAVGDR